jgi:hypothetical protein
MPRSLLTLALLAACTPPDDAARALIGPLPPPMVPGGCDFLLPPPVEVSDTTDLQIVGYTHVSTTVDGNFRLIELRARAQTTAIATFGDVTATLTNAPAPGVFLDDTVTFTRVDPGVVMESDDTLLARVPQQRLQAFRQWMLGGNAQFDLSGWEIATLSPEVLLVDTEGDAAYGGNDHLPDGRRILWFDSGASLLSQLTPGTILLPSPSYEHWTGLDRPALPLMPADTIECGTLFPLRVTELIPGGGAEGGQAWQMGVVGSVDPVSAEEILISLTADSAYPTTADAGIDGPFGTWRGMLQEQSIDGAPCLPGAALDFDDDDVIDECMFTRDRMRFDFELAPDLHLSGHLAWTGVDFSVRSTWRGLELQKSTFSFASTLETSINVHADATVDLPREELTLLEVAAPVLQIPIGPSSINLAVELRAWVAGEGHVRAGGSFGATREDTWTAEVVWTPGDGVTADGSHTSVQPPVTPPRILDGVGATFDASVGAEFGLSAQESLTQTGLEATVRGEGWIGLNVDPGASPWWSVDHGTLSDIDVEFDIADGLLGSWPLTSSLAGEVGALLTDDGTGPVGSYGLDKRYLATASWDTTAGGTFYVSGIDPLPGGGLAVYGGRGSVPYNSYILKLAPDGALVWGKKASWVTGTRDILALPDDGIAAAIEDCTRVIRYNAAGVKLWHKDFDPEGTQPTDCQLAWLPDFAGAPALVLMSNTLLNGYFSPTIALLDPDTGAIRSWRIYDSLDDSSVKGISVTSRGTLLLAGSTWVDAHVLDDVDGAFPANGGALVMEVEPGGGALWATSVNAYRFDRAIETDTGRILAVGDAPTYVYHPRHGMLVASFTSNGSMLWATTYSEDVVWEQTTGGHYTGTAGDSAWDEGTSITAIPGGGAMVAGKSGLGDGVGSWVMRIDDDGEPQWFRLHDGGQSDVIGALETSADGVWMAGDTYSEASGLRRAWLGHLPFEGGSRHDSAAGSFIDRSLQVEVNDLLDTTHIFDFQPGGAPVPFTSREIAATSSTQNSDPATHTAVAVSGAGF